MIDLMINDSGDLIVLQTPRTNNSVRIGFMLSQLSACMLKFEIDGNNRNELVGSEIRIGFSINENKTPSSAAVSKGIDLARQLCMIRLKTSLGELERRKYIGSTLENAKHGFLHTEQMRESVRAKAKASIADIYPNAKVEAEPIVRQIGTSKYIQAMAIKIYDEDITILKYELE